VAIKQLRIWDLDLRIFFRFGHYSFVTCCLLQALSSSAQPILQQRFRFERGLFGTQFRLVFYAPDSLTATRARDAVYACMDSLNQIMSDYLDGSELNKLSETAGSGRALSGRWVRVSPTLFDVLHKARTIARQSGGRYDPTVGPLSLLWRRAVRRGIFPTPRQRRQARRAVGYQFIDLDSLACSVRLQRPGMRLDLGGIGQGFACDEGLAVLHRFGIQAALLDIGGDVLAGEPPPGKPGWRVALDSITVDLANAAITTSGDTYRHLDHRGRRYSHILNPRSGLGLRHFVRVTVRAPDGWRADALTKVFSVAGFRAGRRLVCRFPGVAVQIIENKKGRLRVWQSASF
jgi:FAD:protein FMN transferase